MLGKKGSNPDDDFDFDFGGSDELFSLDDPFSGVNEKPPKGVKGYLKNVVKSVKNIGVKLSQEYLPAAHSLIDDLKEDDSDNSNLKSIDFKTLKAKGTEYAKEAKGIVQDLGKDVKNRVKTGYFFKSEDDSFGGDISFGDEDFGGDSDLGDLSMDDETPAPDSSESGTVKSKTPSMAAVTAKSARAQATIAMRLNRDSINATIGTTQAHIKAQANLFNQSMIIESEHHRQKMLVMKNIASNVGKIIKQNNLSLKAQMEYSLKSLAFSNDIAAMIKEIRNVQWNAFAPKKEDQTDYTKTRYKGIFGNGFNKKGWLNNFKSNFTLNTGLDNLGMLKDMMGGMDGFGISKADMIKSVVGDMVFTNVADLFMPTEMKNNLSRINTAIEGAPQALNNILGRISEKGFAKGGIMDTILGKLPFGDALKGKIQSLAGMAHVQDTTRDRTERYVLKQEDRNKPHPFDNLAHKVLTEVIPRQLAKIEAGVNNHEEQFFDYDKNEFTNMSTIKKMYERERNDALEYSSGYAAANKAMTEKFAKSKNLKKFKLDDKTKEVAIREILRTLMSAGTQFSDTDLERIKDPDDYLGQRVLTTFCNNTNISIDDLSNDQRKSILKDIADGIKDFRQDNNQEFMEFTRSSTMYTNRYNSAMIDLESKYGSMGISSGYDRYAANSQLDRQIADITEKRNRYYNKIKNDKGDVRSSSKKDKETFDRLNDQLKNLKELKEGRADLVNEGLGNFSSDNYEITQLKNTTNNGILNNIYRLLVDGVIVFPQKMSDEVMKRYQLRSSSIKDIDKRAIADKEIEETRAKEEAKKYRDQAIESLEADRKYRSNWFTEKSVPGIIQKSKTLSMLYSGAQRIGNMLTSGITNKAAQFLEHNLYGINFEGVEPSKIEQINEQSKSLYQETYNNAINSGKTESEATELAKKQSLDYIKTEAKKAKDEAKTELKTKAKNYYSSTKSTAQQTISKIKDSGKILSSSFKEGGVVGLVSTISSGVKGFSKKTLDDIKNHPAFKELSDSFKEDGENLSKYIQDKAETDKFVAKLLQTGKITQDQAKTFYDTVRSKGVLEGFNLLKDNIVNSKAAKSVQKGIDTIANTKVGKGISNTIDTAKNSEIGQKTIKTTQQIANKVKTKVSEIKMILSDKLGNIKVGDKTLSDTVANINNTELIQQLKNTPDPVEKAKLLLKYGGDEVAEFKNSITNFITEQSVSSGKRGTFFTGVSNFIFGKKKTEGNKEDLSNDLTRRQGTKEDQKLDKEEEEKKENEKKHLNFLEKIATALPFFTKNGIKLDKETTDKLDESNQKAADKMADAAESAAASGSGGILDKVTGLIDKTGLGDTAVGQAVKQNLNKISGGLGFLKKIPGLNKVSGLAGGGLKKVATGVLTSIGGVGAGIAKGFAKGFAKGGIKGAIGGAAKGTLGLAGKAVGGTVKGSAKAVGKAHKTFFSLLDKVTQAIVKKFPGGKFIIEKIMQPLKQGITKIIGKLAAKIGLSIGAMGTIVAALASFAAGMTKGATTCKKDLHLGKDIKPTASMRLICGLASGFNALLFGIPDIVAKMIFKYESFAQWMYDKFGNQAEKEAIARYHRYCTMKAKVYGISDFNKLIAYENHNAVDKVGRSALHILTLGIAKSNDEKEASMLGFNSVEVFKYWKEKKYEPLEDLREQVAENYGGTKVVDRIEKYDADENNDGEISEDEQEKSDEQQANIENQQNFRKDFLEQARKWVIDNKLAWLNDKCDTKKFKKFTNQDAKEIQSKTEKVKKIGGTISKGAVTAFSFTPIGLLATKQGRENLKKAGTAIVKGAKFVGGKIKDLKNIVINFAGKAKDKLSDISNSIKEGAKNLAKKGINKVKEIAQGAKDVVVRITNFVKKFLENKKIKAIQGYVTIKEIFSTIIKAISEKCKVDKAFATKMGIETAIFTVTLPVTVVRAVASFGIGYLAPGKYLGINIPQKTKKIKLIGAIIATIKSILPSADQACADMLGKTLKRIVFDAVMRNREQATNDTFLIEKAKILGLTVEAMQKYENKLNESSTGKKIKNFFSNIFGGGADKADADLCGFVDLEVFKFWREEKYEPLRQLEETTAHKFGDLDDMRSETPKDPEAQKKFRQAYLRMAKEYVKDRGLEWLTYKTTREEYESRKKAKTLYLKADAQVKQEKAENSGKNSLWQRFKNFAFSSNRDTRGTAKQMYQSSNTKGNYVKIDADDTKAMEETLQKEYKYDQKAMGVMAQASSSIKSFWKSISPNFYGDQKPATDPGDRDVAKGGVELAFAGKGGPEGISEGLITKYRDLRSKVNTVTDKTKQIIKKTKNTISNKLDDAFGMNEPKIDRAKVMNSITSDFAKNFGKELNERLNILEEMHKENIRHNKVAENFYNALVALVQQVASNTSNISAGPSQLDNFINAIVK